MIGWLSRLYRLDRYKTPVARERALLVYALSTLFAVGLLAFSLLDALQGSASFLRGDYSEGRFTAVLVTVLIALSLFGIIGTRQGIPGSAFVPIATTFILAVGGLIALAPGFPVLFAVFILTVALLYNETAGFAAWAISCVVLIIFMLVTPVVESTYFPSSLDIIVASVALFVVALLALFFRRLVRSTEIETRVAGVENQMRIATITTEISSRITRQTALSDVLNGAVELIIERYPEIYHAQVFLIDPETQIARLSASTGAAGVRLLERRHGLAVGSRSVIGQVTGAGQPVITRAGETVHAPNPLLPETEAEAAFPLRLGDTIIGALDLQSRQADAFRPAEIPIFQSLADTLTVGIDNARLAEQTAQRLAENQRLLEQSRQSAREVERLNRELTREAWSGTLAPRSDAFGMLIDVETGDLSPDPDGSPVLLEAAESNLPVDALDEAGQTRLFAVPVRVRGQVIGAMEFELPADRPLDDAEIALAQAAGDQLGIALDSARLAEQTRSLAARERKASEIASELLSVNDVNALLDRAASSFSEALGAVFTRVTVSADMLRDEADRAGDALANGHHDAPQPLLAGAAETPDKDD